MHKIIQKSVIATSAMLLFAVCADTHVWKSEGRVNDWDWNESGNFESGSAPEAGDIVQLPSSADIFVNGIDSASLAVVSELEQIVLPSPNSRVIFDLGSDVDLSIKGAISGVLEAGRKSLNSNSAEYKKGEVIKRGDGTLRLSRVRYSDDSGNDVYAYYTSIVCEEGVLKMQELPSTDSTKYMSWFLGHVAVSNNATLFLASCAYKDVPTTSVRRSLLSHRRDRILSLIGSYGIITTTSPSMGNLTLFA